MDPIDQALERIRDRLLDLTRRNRLLNYRMTSARGVRLIGADPSMLLQGLVKDDEAFSFRPRPEPEDNQEMDTPGEADETMEAEEAGPSYAIVLESGTEEEADPTVLQTSHLAKDLDKRLRGTMGYATLYLQEQGVNALFLALGSLTWFESADSDVENRAPLLLVPVRLERANVRARYQLRFLEDEVQLNLSLAERLRRDFDLELYPDLNLDEPGSLDLNQLFDNVEAMLQAFPRWRVTRDHVVVDIFAFSKLAMYQDLDPTRWPANRQPSSHPILRGLVGEGFQEDELALSPHDFIDEHIAPEDLYLVVDADSSQLRALFEASKHDTLVVQGPPGTGKSQTITNLVSQAVGDGLSVLFVSEKTAALEVVKNNLETVGLGDACLELHSHKANKKQFLEDLRRTADLEAEHHQTEARVRRLQLLREQLNAYADAVNTPVRQSGLTPHQLHGAYLRAANALKESSAPPELRVEGMEDWSKEKWALLRPLVRELESWSDRWGPPTTHPYWLSGLRATLPGTAGRVQERIQEALIALRDLRAAGEALASALDDQAPQTRGEAEAVSAVADVILSAPEDFEGFRVDDLSWLDQTEELTEALEHLAFVRDSQDRYGSLLLENAWNKPLETVRRDLRQYGRGPLRFFSGRFRAAKRATADLFRDVPPKELTKQIQVLDTILKVQRSERQVEEHGNAAARALGPHWRQHDPKRLLSCVEQLVVLKQRADQGEVPHRVFRLLAGTSDRLGLQRKREEVAAALERHADALRVALDEVSYDETRYEREVPLEAATYRDQEDLLTRWTESTNRLQEIVTLNHILDRLEEEGLGGVVAAALEWADAGQNLVDAVEKRWYELLLEQAYTERPALASFDGGTQEQRVREFQELEELALDQNRAKVRAEHLRRLPSSSTAVGSTFLAQQMKRQRGHKPIRQILKQAGSAVQRIKPVFMMSPLSIAKYIEPGTIDFDLVVFDEASQVRPEDALGAILRGKRAVVVGDSKQLPPTSFFDAMDDGNANQAVLALESILDVFETQGAPSVMLRWHYRSEHESLIAVSNERFYTPPGLFVFPSADGEALGLRLHHLPDTVYKSSRNVKEARVIANAVIEHARLRPHESLAVAAFSQPQMMTIEDELERLRRDNPRLESFFAADKEEPFFVKNLETIQGDQRDVIFISVGYGRNEDGEPSMNFGPVNQAGGERRLNVLFTRAKKRCEIFSNLRADDIRSTGAAGLEVLRAYLHYAETGRLADLPTPHGGFGSPFEEQVHRELVKHRYTVDSQVGIAGYFIDLAIVDPERPGSYLLGIECDGATYHSARSARDRDRLRQAVLERRGWRIHRIWSTDWFRDPERQVRKVLEALERAKIGRPERATTAFVHTVPVPPTPEATEPDHHEGVAPGGADDPGGPPVRLRANADHSSSPRPYGSPQEASASGAVAPRPLVNSEDDEGGSWHADDGRDDPQSAGEYAEDEADEPVLPIHLSRAEEGLLGPMQAVLGRAPGPLKATEIADRLMRDHRLVLDKRQVNRILYRHRDELFERTQDFRWRLISNNPGPGAPSVSEPVTETATPTQGLTDEQRVIAGLTPSLFLDLREWARANGHFEQHEQDWLFYMGSQILPRHVAHPRQAASLMRLLLEARELGFDWEDPPPGQEGQG